MVLTPLRGAGRARRLASAVKKRFLDEDPRLAIAMAPAVLLSMLLFSRGPSTTFFFDEEQAIVANPYVRSASDPASAVGWLDALHRDFWGLEPRGTIGSYRPVPDAIWRLLWAAGLREGSAFWYALLDAVLHGINGALLVALVWNWTRKRSAAWLAGVIFVSTAVLTEAVSSAVGLADVLAGTAALVALLSVALPLPLMAGTLAVATMLGLCSKESALCIVPLAPLAALMTSPAISSASARARTRPEGLQRWLRAGVATIATVTSFVVYVETRRRWFHCPAPPWLSVDANAGKPLPARIFAAALRWYAQPTLPRDPINNPLIDASPSYRVAGALRVFARGLRQLLFPAALSGDYSASQEPIPDRIVFPESVVGAVAMGLLLLGAPLAGLLGWLRSRRQPPASVDPSPTSGRASDLLPIAGFAAAWCFGAYFPVSNIAVVLPTVRAERFWYLPAIGSAVLLAVGFVRVFETARSDAERVGLRALLAAFVAIQCIAAWRHARDYASDLDFWEATRKAAPKSAKAHLNYSLAVGARGDLAARLAENEEALRLAPNWPMANVYEGDVLCRLRRTREGLPYFLRGFSLAPNDEHLVAAGLQSLWDAHQFEVDSPVPGDLEELADHHPGTWLAYLVRDTVENGTQRRGVDRRYLPRAVP